MNIQVGDLLKFQSTKENNDIGVAMVIKAEKNTISLDMTYDLFWFSNNFDDELNGIVTGYTEWQLKDNTWSKIS